MAASSRAARLLSFAAALFFTAAVAFGQGDLMPYTSANLVSDIAGRAPHTDPNLVNPWGITYGNAFWIADNGTGVSTLYQMDGTPLSLVVTIPPSASNTEGVSAPTGQVFNTGSGFVVSNGSASGPATFIFVSEDGAISGWNNNVSATQAILAVDNGAHGAVYKGSTLASTNSGDRLYVTNFRAAKVEIYDQNFNEIDTAQTFVDPTIPVGYAPFGIQSINGSIYVTYALQDPEKMDDIPGRGHGFVSVFDTGGNFIQRLISRRPLDSPWGVALAPDGFGKASGRLLVGNFGNGRINAFSLSNGKGHGPLRNAKGAELVYKGLWGMLFLNTDLYITAGPQGETHGLFAKISPAQQ